MCRERHGISRVLGGGWSSCGDSPNCGARRQAGVAGFRRGCNQCKGQCVICCDRAVNRLVTQVADRAAGFGRAVTMMMQDDASEGHRHQQQRQQRYRNHQIPCWTSLQHGRGGYSKPQYQSYSRCPRDPMGCACKGTGMAGVRGCLKGSAARLLSSIVRGLFQPARRTFRRVCAAGRQFPAGGREA